MYRAVETRNEQVEIIAPSEVYTEKLDRPWSSFGTKRTILISYRAYDTVKVTRSTSKTHKPPSDIFFFCLRLLEYDPNSEDPQRGRAIIEYLESVPNILPRDVRRDVYRNIVNAYALDLSARGFTHLYLRAEPPDVGESYIFPGSWQGSKKRSSADMPAYEYLLKWYTGLFEYLLREDSISDYCKISDNLRGVDDLKSLPIFDGDITLPRVLEIVFARDRTIYDDERFAELFKSQMSLLRNVAYPEIYFVLTLVDGVPQLKYDGQMYRHGPPMKRGVTENYKGISLFCERHGLSFRNKEEAAQASAALWLELFVTAYSPSHIKRCADGGCERLRRLLKADRWHDRQFSELTYILSAFRAETDAEDERALSPHVKRQKPTNRNTPDLVDPGAHPKR
ncbi:hypothetical protein, variant 1 [Sphaeroforma arctica JP610]|nr:hypothetical protein, variant 1 [Sphaeroforma arctica JP610]KNC74721.1 hypothetical protein, variant 1 [Sphaeroforma arctica JP610]|eukprot:XP_014148623.1 hypothetical protein, variant 1 [Sphaeroforma arctica JP610]